MRVSGIVPSERERVAGRPIRRLHGGDARGSGGVFVKIEGCRRAPATDVADGINRANLECMCTRTRRENAADGRPIRGIGTIRSVYQVLVGGYAGAGIAWI